MSLVGPIGYAFGSVHSGTEFFFDRYYCTLPYLMLLIYLGKSDNNGRRGRAASRILQKSMSCPLMYAHLCTDTMSRASEIKSRQLQKPTTQHQVELSFQQPSSRMADSKPSRPIILFLTSTRV